MKSILITLDSLNRRYLPIYGNTWVQTPNLDRLAARSCVFDRHWTASAPCMPARHDILTGRMEFLERNWSGLQPYDRTLPELLRAAGGFSHMLTDHDHYFHVGGENYHSVFDSWEFLRGQEYDIYQSALGRFEPIEHYGTYHRQYQANRAAFRSERDYPTPATFDKAADWVRRHAEADNWFLYLDCFDPHEPFDVPDDFDITYDDDYDGPFFNWPEYKAVDVPPEAVEHIRKQYAKTLSMADRWLGKLLDVLDELGLWDEVAVILSTDHGYLLGEHGYFAKNYTPAYNELYHIPLLIHLPGMKETTRCAAITQTVDLFPTLLDLMGLDAADIPYRLHGRSLLPLIREDVEQVRDYALFGIFGKQVNLYDGRYTYFRAAAREDNMPLNLYVGTPTTIFHYWSPDHIADLSKLETGPFLSWTDYPVYKLGADNIRLSDPSHRFDRRYPEISQNLLFDIQADYAQQHPLTDEALERRMCDLLVRALEEHDAPADQYERLGLIRPQKE